MMTRMRIGVSVAFLGVCWALATPAAGAKKCPPDSVPVGRLCVDKYEASVWETNNPNLVKLIQSGKATEAQLLNGGAIQRGVNSDDYPCSDDGNNCTTIYAVSIPRVPPSRFITWFQAQQAAANSGKQLLTNAEWQMAAAGTVDPFFGSGFNTGNDGLTNTMCHTLNASSLVRETGNAGATRGGADSCISRWGVEDMVGNVWEWVADWVPVSAGCAPALFDIDLNCQIGGPTTSGPGALFRGGDFSNAGAGGVFAIFGSTPSAAFGGVGLRAAR